MQLKYRCKIWIEETLPHLSEANVGEVALLLLQLWGSRQEHSKEKIAEKHYMGLLQDKQLITMVIQRSTFRHQMQSQRLVITTHIQYTSFP